MADPAAVLGFLYVGSRKAARNEAWLKERGISHILNVTPSRETDPVAGVPNFFERSGRFKYKRVPVFDSHGEDLRKYFPECNAFIDEARFQGGVLVHCNQGVSRSVAVVLAYLVDRRGMTLPDALDMVRRKRPQAQPHEQFIAQLEAFARVARPSDAAAKRPRAAGAPESADAAAAKRPYRPDTLAAGPAGGRPAPGPIGPSLPPTIGPALPPSAAAPTAAIGPALPPSASASAPIGLSLPPSASSSAPIGPSLPPSASLPAPIAP